MKKKLLPLALAAAAGLTGINSAHAVNVNPAGTGEVLIYPYYTVEGGQDTLVSVVNTTGNYKAVKVRILEAMNTQEVLDFNLYLSPNDHWSAAIQATSDGAQIVTGDTSCTVPLSLSAKTVGSTGTAQPFRNFEFTADSVNGLDRTREGYIEIIEMGEIDLTAPAAGAPATTTTTGAQAGAAILHANGVPANCALLDTEWKAGGQFQVSTSNLVDEPTGGLYGYGVLVDVAEGTAAGYDAIALNAYRDNPLHTNPGALTPSLAQTSPEEAVVVNELGVAQTATFDAGIDAVSAVLMHSAISNDYVLDSAIGAGTDWVVTMPTKRDYVNGVAANTVRAPFSSTWNTTTSSACELIELKYFDREEGEVQVVAADNDFSPRPPSVDDPVIALCKEANVLTFNSSNVLEASTRVKNDLTLEDGFVNGWMKMSLVTGNTLPATTSVVNVSGLTAADAESIIDPAVRRLTSYDGAGDHGAAGTFTFTGLPVVGFAVQSYVNGDVSGTLANYNAAVAHKTSTTITAN